MQPHSFACTFFCVALCGVACSLPLQDNEVDEEAQMEALNSTLRLCSTHHRHVAPLKFDQPSTVDAFFAWVMSLRDESPNLNFSTLLYLATMVHSSIYCDFHATLP